MNIGLFTDTYYPEINGVANSVYVLKQSLEAKGHNVYVFTTTTKGAPEHEYNVFRVHSLPFVFMPDRRVGLMYQPKYANMIRKLNLDIIHTHTEFSLRIFANIMAKELNIPLTHTYHTIYEDYTHYFAPFKPLNNKAKAFARSYTRKVCNEVEEVIVPSNKTKELLEKYCVYKNINVIPTGISLGKFDAVQYPDSEVLKVKEQYGILPEDKVILYLGRVSKEKNIEEVLEAMPEIIKQHDKVKFAVVGGGPDLENLTEMADKLKVSDHVVFLGEKPWNEIGLYYQLGDVFVSASQSETQGLTYIEAMAAGLPVVAKKDQCLDEILIPDYNGYTFETREELMEGINHVLFDKDIPFGENSIQIVQSYSTETFGDRVEKVYKKILHNAGIALEA